MNPKPDRDTFLQIAHTYGTPVYVYHAEKIIAQYQRLNQAFASCRHRIFYAAKALTNIHILKLIRETGAGVDCSSIFEARLARIAGFEPQEILYTSNGIHFSEIKEAKEMGVLINIDSLSNLDKFGAEYGDSYPVGVRLRPNILAGGNLKISTGHEKSKFGISVNQIDKVLELQQKYNLQISTLHIHTGSEIKEVSVFMQGLKILFDLIPAFKTIRHIDMGGGMKVAYQEAEPVTDIEALGTAVSKAVNEYNLAEHTDLEIWLEPGKFLVSEAGYFISTVNVLKETGAGLFAAVNTGFNHLIRPMFYDAYHKIENISNPNGALKNYVVTGNICETDNFAWDRPLPEIRENDVLIFYNAGAYGYEMASNFNSRLRPPEVLLRDGKTKLIRRRETFDDLLKTQTDI